MHSAYVRARGQGLSHEDANEAGRGARMLEAQWAAAAAAGQPPAGGSAPHASMPAAAGAAPRAPPAPPATPAPKVRKQVHAHRASWTRQSTKQLIADLKRFGKGRFQVILAHHGNRRSDGQPSLYPVRTLPITVSSRMSWSR